MRAFGQQSSIDVEARGPRFRQQTENAILLPPNGAISTCW